VLRAYFGQFEPAEDRNDMILQQIAVCALGFLPGIRRADRIQPGVQELRDGLPFRLGWEPLRQAGLEFTEFGKRLCLCSTVDSRSLLTPARVVSDSQLSSPAAI
jgi:hypothetical protein